VKDRGHRRRHRPVARAIRHSCSRPAIGDDAAPGTARGRPAVNEGLRHDPMV